MQQLQTQEPPLSNMTTAQPSEHIDEHYPQATEQQMAPSKVEELLAVVETEARKRRRNHRMYTGIFLGVMGLMVLLGVLSVLLHHKFPAQMFSHIGWMSALIGTAAAMSKKHKAAATQLAQYKDVRIVGPMADILDSQDKNIRFLAEQKLIELLPQLRANHADLLNEAQRQSLHRALKGKNTALVRAILTALEQVGDENALPTVEKLANGAYSAARNPKVRVAARECLAFLQLRAEQRLAQQTLLRAAGPADTPSDTLLRPATATPVQADSDQLLRPG